MFCVGCSDCGSRKHKGDGASLPSVVDILAKAAKVSGKLGGVTGVFAGAHIWNQQIKVGLWKALGLSTEKYKFITWDHYCT